MEKFLHFLRIVFSFLCLLLYQMIIQLIQLYRYFKKKYPLATPITCFVVAAHLALLVFLNHKPNKSTLPPSFKKIQVNTITLNPPTPPRPKPQPKQEKKETVLDKRKPKPSIKETKEKKESPKPIVKKTKDKSSQVTHKKKPTSNATPPPVAKEDPQEKFEKEHLYYSELANILRAFLQLPEKGIVKIELTLDRLGTVTELNVIYAQSALNTAYLKEQVPKLKFPPFGSHFFGQKNHSFLLSLSNDNAV